VRRSKSEGKQMSRFVLVNLVVGSSLPRLDSAISLEFPDKQALFRER